MLVVPSEGTKTLAQFLATGRPLTPYVALFVNDYIPDHTTTLADLQECVVPGYARILLGAPASILGQADGSTIMRWASVTWAGFAPPPVQTAFGYFAVQVDAMNVLRLLWLERMTPKIPIINPTIGIAFAPQLVVQTLFG